MVLKVVASYNQLTYEGTWNASTNTPTLTSSVGPTNGYYIVSVAGNTNLNGITNWNVGDWAIFNGTQWERIAGGNTETFNNITVTSLTGYMYANNSSPVTASTTIPVASVTGAVPNTVNVIAGTGLSGGGALTGNVTLTNAGVTAFNTRTGAVTLTSSDVTTALGYTPGTVSSVATGTGLSGGPITSTGTISITNTGVTAATYGLANSVPQIALNAQGQATSASNVLISIANTQVSGLGTMATQNANSVAITGGTISGLSSPLPVASGGTGQSSFTTGAILYGSGSSAINYSSQWQISGTGALVINSNPGTSGQVLSSQGPTAQPQWLTLGTMASQNANNVVITGGTINVTLVNHTANVSSTATFATSSLPLVPAGYLIIDLNGTNVKIPYYGV